MSITNQGSRYTLKQKLQVIAILRKNYNNYSRTCTETGVSRGSLRNWVKEYGDSIPDITTTIKPASGPTSEVSVEVVMDLQTRQENFLEKIFTAKEKLLQRLMDLAPQEKNMDKVQKALQTVSLMDGTIRSTLDPPEKPTINIYQQLNQQIIDHQKNIEPNETD